jgi:hypothetical protein
MNPSVPAALTRLIVPEAVTVDVRLTDVPVAAPMFGVTRVGVLAKTSAPVPVSSVTAEARFALEGVARNVATFAPNPETPVLIGRPVQFVRVPDVGVPRSGVVRDGDVPNTSAPEPVSPVTAAARLAELGVCSHVATPDPKAVKPVPPLPSGRVPDTSAVRLTAPNVGAPAALPWRTVVVVPSDPSDTGAPPAPPPSVRAFAVRAADEAIVLELEKYGTPPLVPDVIPVPPWDTGTVPDRLPVG